MNKKILTIGSILTASLPVATVVACGSDSGGIKANNNVIEENYKYDLLGTKTFMDTFHNSNIRSGAYIYIDVPSEHTHIAVGTNIKERFRAASQTKMIAGLLAYILEDEGVLTLTDTIDKYLTPAHLAKLKEIKANAQTITIKQLIEHTSGLAGYLNQAKNSSLTDAEFSKKRAKANTVNSFDSMIDLAKSVPSEITNWAQQGTYEYSNTGYYVLGQLFENKTKKSFKELAKTKIFDKLGMTNTDFNHSGLTSFGPSAVENNLKYPTYGAAAGVVSTLEDLQKFGFSIVSKNTNIMKATEWSKFITDNNNLIHSKTSGALESSFGGLLGHSGHSLASYSNSGFSSKDITDGTHHINVNFYLGWYVSSNQNHIDNFDKINTQLGTDINKIFDAMKAP